VVRHARALQPEGFFTPATEHERISALQPHDRLSAPARTDQQLGDRVLRQRMAAGALADKKLLGLARVLQNARVDQRVIQHEIGRSQLRDRRPRQQTWVARSGTNQRHVTTYPHDPSRYNLLSASSSRGLRCSIGTLLRFHSVRCSCAASSQRSTSAGSRRSIASRNNAVSAGARPSVEIAMVTPARRTTPLRYAVPCAGSSTALTKM